MKLIGLVDYTALLLAIVKKNPSPADKVAMDFFKSKRSLGSNDRRFIMDVLFFTLRNLLLIEHLSNKIKQENNDILENISKNSNLKSKPEDYFIILNAILLINSIEDFNCYKYIFKNVIRTENSQLDNFLHIFLLYFQNTFFLTNEIIFNWKKNLIYYYDLIKNSFFCKIKSIDTINDKYIKYLELRYSFPEWIIKILLNRNISQPKFLHDLARSFTDNAPITIRVYSNRMNEIHIIEEIFKKDGINIEKCAISPVAYNLSRRIYLNEHLLYKNGYIEIQDEASQLVSFALAPEQNWVILDACAGAGGKSLHLADLQNDKGKIIALDKEYNRLSEIPRRAKNAGLSSIETYLVDERSIPKINDRNVIFFKKRLFDAVLVDAPCSGMGTLRRDPMKKYRTTQRLVEKLSHIQLAILEHYSQFLKPGGVLVYATCSIMPQENEMVVENFLEKHKDFEPNPLIEGFKKYGINIPDLSEQYYYTFYPNLFNTDGFFIARMKRKF